MNTKKKAFILQFNSFLNKEIINKCVNFILVENNPYL